MLAVLKQVVGLDVDAKQLKVNFKFLHPNQRSKVRGSRTFSNTPKGFEDLVKWVSNKQMKNLPVHFVMEATGVYYENVAYFLYALVDSEVHVVLPNQSAAYIKSLNQKNKTDELDASALAQMGIERDLNIWQPASTQMRTLKKLSRERIRLLDEKTLVSNQLHAEQKSHQPEKTIVNRMKKRIAFIAKQITQVEKQLKKVVDKDPQLKQRVDNVCTAKGLGFITVIGVVAEMNGFTLFRNRAQVVSYNGYDVVQKQSGSSILTKPKISKKGNAYVRKMLYFPAMTAVRHDEHHRAYYNRIFEKTHIKMKGYVAIQRKLLLLIYALYTKNQPYNPKQHQERQEELRLATEKNASLKQNQSKSELNPV